MHRWIFGAVVATIAVLLLLVGISAHAAQTSVQPSNGGTGSTQIPGYGQIPVGNAGGTYTPLATSSLGLTAGAGGSPGQVQVNSNGVLFGVSTTTASCSGNVSCPVFTILGITPITITGSGGGGSSFGQAFEINVAGFLAPTTTKTILANGGFISQGSSTVTGTLNVSGVNIGSLGGFLKAVAGAVSTALINLTSDVTGTLPSANGGTGSTTLSGILKGNGTNAVQTAIANNDYQLPISLTTTGSSGAATFNGSTLNIPQYAGSGASSTLLGDTNSFSGNDTFNNTITGSVSGNAGTATKLLNARTINNVSFDGTGNITINAASSTLLGDTNLFSGTDKFSNAITVGSLSGLIGGNNGLLYGFASSSLFGYTPLNPTRNINTQYPVLGGGDLSADRTFSLAFGTTTSNTFAGTQTFNNVTINGTCTGCSSGSGITSIGPTGQSQSGANQTLATSTTGTDFTITATGNTQTFNLPVASASNTGKLSSADWTTFNNKLSGNQTITLSGAVTGSGATAISTSFGNANANTVLANQTSASAAPSFIATSTFFGTGTGGQHLVWNNGIPQWVATTTFTGTAPISLTFSNGQVTGACTTASAGVTGCLTGTDWNTFNGKQAAGNYITALTGDVTASGPGSVAATIANNVVTYAKFQQVAANSVVGNNTSATANAVAIATSSLFGTGLGGQILTWNNGVPQWVASTTYANGTGISTAFGNGALTITNTSPLSALTTSFPLNLSGTTLSFGGLSTTTNLTTNSIPIATGVNTFGNSSLTQIAGTTFLNGAPIIDGGGDWLGNIIQAGTQGLIIQPTATSSAIFGNLVQAGGITQVTASQTIVPATFCGTGEVVVASSTAAAVTLTLPSRAWIQSFANGLPNGPCSPTAWPSSFAQQTIVNNSSFPVTETATDTLGYVFEYGPGTSNVLQPGQTWLITGQLSNEYNFPQGFGGSNSTIRVHAQLYSTTGTASSSLLSVSQKAWFGGTATTTIDSAGNLVIPSGSNLTITGKSDGCATFATGVLNSTGSVCGSSGSSGGTWATTTSLVAGELINHPNNNTDIVTVGGTSTSTSPFSIDPNLLIGPFLKIGTSTNWASLAIHLNPTDPTLQTMAFAIGSSTASATTTLFSISNVGSIFTQLADGLVGAVSGTLTHLTLSAGLLFSGGKLSTVEHASYTYATSTWVGTTTIPIEVGYGETWNSTQCFTDTGTVNVQVGYGTASTSLLNASTTIGTFNYASNNIMTAGNKVKVDIGTPASSPTKITCTYQKTTN
jgi:hypothetical protein